MPVKDSDVLDSWVDEFPMVDSDLLCLAVWLDDFPRATGSRCDYVLGFPLGRIDGISVLKFGDEVWFKTKGGKGGFFGTPSSLVVYVFVRAHVLGCSRRSTVHWSSYQ